MSDIDLAILDVLSRIRTSMGDATEAKQDAIKAKTDNLPPNPANELLLEAAIANLITRAKGLDDIHDDVGSMGTVVDAINIELSEILSLTRTGADIAVTAAETNLFIDDAPTKILNGMSILIDTTNMGAGDTYEFKEYYRIESGGAYLQKEDTVANPTRTYSDAQSVPLKTFNLETYRYGCKVTAKKTAGTDRSFKIEAIREA